MTPPPIAPTVLADVLDELPPRLRKRVDATLSRAAEWTITHTRESARAELDPDTTLFWTLHSGILTTAADLTCTCLLAPRCLHRGIAVAAADIAEPAPDPAAPGAAPAPDPGNPGPAPGASTPDPGEAATTAADPDAATPAADPSDSSAAGDPGGSATTATEPSVPATPTAEPGGSAAAAGGPSEPVESATGSGGSAGLAAGSGGAAAAVGGPGGSRAAAGGQSGSAVVVAGAGGSAAAVAGAGGLATAAGAGGAVGGVGGSGSGRSGAGVPVAGGAEVVAPVRAAERAAAGALWAACATVLRSGATGSGAVVRAEVLRAAHTARVAGLHRAAAGGLRIAASLAAGRAGDSAFDREVLAADLVDLMLVCHDLRTGHGDPAELRGTARREYRPIGSLRLYGLCTEAVVAATGYGGVVTHLVDQGGTPWTIPAITPGGAERVPAAANGPVAVGESGLTHRGLGRAGLLLSGGTASADRRLGAGKAVRAVAASGAAWDAPPLADLWAQPLADQVTRAFAADTRPDAHRPAGADLLFLDATVLGAAAGALRVSTGDAHIDLVSDGGRSLDNLRVLAGAARLRLRAVARLLPDRPATALAIAVSGDPEHLSLPADHHGRVDLGLDRLQRSHVVPTEPRDLPTHPEPTHHTSPGPEAAPCASTDPEHARCTPTDPESTRRVVTHRTPAPLRPLELLLHRIALGGRAVAATSTAAREIAALTGNGLTTTASLLSDIAATARDRERDAFGRVVRDTGDAFPLAWLRAGLHLREVNRALARRAWLAATTPPT